MNGDIFFRYFDGENTFSKEQVYKYFAEPCGMLTEEEFIDIYYQLGKDYAGVLYSWKNYIEKKYPNTKKIVMQRDANILLELGMKATSIWLNYDIIDNENMNSIINYIERLEINHSVIIDVGIMGNVMALIEENNINNISVEFLLSANKYINGFLNNYISSDFDINFMITIVRSLENIFKEYRKVRYINEINKMVRYDQSVLTSAANKFFYGIQDGNKNLKSSLIKLKNRYNETNNMGRFTGIICENYIISDYEKRLIEIRYERMKKNEERKSKSIVG